MKLAGTIDRIEIKTETDEEWAHAQAMINLGRREDRREPLIYWGDSDTFNGALIINSVGCDLSDEEWNNRLAAMAEASPTAAAPAVSDE